MHIHETGLIASVWKSTIIVPIPEGGNRKNKNKNEINSYRPTALTTNVGQLIFFFPGYHTFVKRIMQFQLIRQDFANANEQSVNNTYQKNSYRR